MDSLRPVSGILLAGGKSRRFGSSKAFARIGTQTLGERVATMLRSVADHSVVVLAAPGATSPAPSLPVVFDEPAGVGPLGGICAGLRASAQDWGLVVACDMPGLTAEALQRLLAARNSEIDAVVARDPAGDLHPLAGCYRTTLAESMHAYVAGGHRSVKRFLDNIRVDTVLLPSGVLANINRQEDLAAFRNAAT